MPRFLRLGRVSPAIITSTHQHQWPPYPPECEDEYGDGYDCDKGPGADGVGYAGISGRVRRMFHRPRPVRSLAAERRATGNPKWFMSAPVPSTGGVETGALLIDTDGFRIQHGDDF